VIGRPCFTPLDTPWTNPTRHANLASSNRWGTRSCRSRLALSWPRRPARNWSTSVRRAEAPGQHGSHGARPARKPGLCSQMAAQQTRESLDLRRQRRLYRPQPMAMAGAHAGHGILRPSVLPADPQERPHGGL